MPNIKVVSNVGRYEQYIINMGGLKVKMSEILGGIPIKTDEAIEKASKRVGKRAVEQLKENSPVGERTKNSGRYAKGWKLKRERGVYILYNSTDYQLTHLLENGHDIIVKGEKIGHFNGIKHIEPVEQEIKDTIIDEIMEELDTL